jgi:hypothetical protein
MNTLRDLHEAFHELELRADAVEAPGEPFVRHRSARRLVAPAASVAAVAAVALTITGVTVWHDGSGSPSDTAAGHSGATQPQTVVSEPVTQTTPAPASFQPPATPDALAAKAREILAGVATITVTDGGDNVQMTLPSGMRGGDDHGGRVALPSSDNSNGAGIVGALTADGRTGGFDLNVSNIGRSVRGAGCDMSNRSSRCRISTLGDGSSLAVEHWQDPSVPGGVTYQVELVRPDGADILMHLSTERDPKGGGPVLSSQLPLSVGQMTDFVSSDQW